MHEFGYNPGGSPHLLPLQPDHPKNTKVVTLPPPETDKLNDKKTDIAILQPLLPQQILTLPSCQVNLLL